MGRLTADERRRANELRRVRAAQRAPRAVTVEEFEARGEGWTRGARLATLLAVAAGGTIALAELAQQLSLYGPGSLLDWLIPRL